MTESTPISSITSVRRLRNPVLALLAGGLIPLSLSPVDIWPAAVLGIFGLCLVLQGLSPRQAAMVGWCFGLGMFGMGSSWVYVSIATYGNVGMFLSVLITLLFIAGLALLIALQCWLLQKFLTQSAQPLAFSALWLLGEWLRTWLLTGFPWLFLGYGHINSVLGSLAPVFGVLGIGFVVALTGSTLFYLVRMCLQGRQASPGTVHRGSSAILQASPLLLAWLLALALSPVQWVEAIDEPPLSVGVVHGIIPQEEKFDMNLLLEHIDYFEEMSTSLWGHDLILWPETAIALYYHQALSLLDYLDAEAAAQGSSLVSGIFYSEQGQVHNSIIGLGLGDGLYHKQKLVPFGEYVPLQGVIGPVMQIFNLPMSTIQPGPARQNLLSAGQLSLAPFICYEVVYPDFVRKSARNADILVTISNDTWFGNSWGPRQHLQMAAMRALENGRYMLRSTNNGLSAIIDEKGQVLARSTQFEAQVLSGTARRFSGNTPFSRWGSWPVVLLALLTAALCAAKTRHRS